MDDLELADKIVALGVGCKANDGKYDRTNWRASDVTEDSITRLCHQFANQFVRDWRVAGALMEKHCVNHPMKMGVMEPGQGFTACAEVLGAHIFIDNESLPRAITEACCGALKVIEQGENDG